MPKKFDDVVRWAFGLILIAVAKLLLDTLTKISESIDTLNVKMAVVVEQVATQNGVNTQFEKRLGKLEEMVPRAKCRTH